MPQLLMPKKLIYGKKALEKIRPERFEHTIVISNGGFLEARGFLHCIESRLKRTASRISRVINDNAEEAYRLAFEIHLAEEIDCIIAVGSSEIIDCGMLLSKESGAEFIAVPVCSACGMTDFESGSYFEYCKSPDCLVLEPSLMHCVSSATIAYDGFACLAYAFDAMCHDSNSIIDAISYNGAVGIIKNIIPAFRGNMDIMEKLMYSMYLAVAAHRNTPDVRTSLLSEACNFFSDFGYSKNSICAVCLPSVLEYETDILKDSLARMANDLGLCYTHDSKELASAKMLDEIRSIQASLGIMRSISGFGMDFEEFNDLKLNRNVPTDLLDLCFNGSFKFVRYQSAY